MKSLSRAFLCSAVLVALLAAGSLAKTATVSYRKIDAQDGAKANLTIKGKAFPYYKLEPGTKISVKVTGPTYLKVTARAVVSSKDKPDNFSLTRKISGRRKQLTVARATHYSDAATSSVSGELIGQSRSITYKIPKGERTVTIALRKSAKEPVYLRFGVKDSTAKQKKNYVAYLPTKFPEEVHLTVNEGDYIYYRVNNSDKVELEVIGPTTLKCISRLEFDQSMHGDKPYRLQIRENGKVVRTKGHKAKISASARYTTKSDKVLGKGDNLYFKVPAGKHTYNISTPDAGNSLLLRFYLPEKALGKTLDINGKKGRTNG